MSSPLYDYDARLRWRVWVAATLVDECWVDASNPDAQLHTVRMRQRHALIVASAQILDQPWLIELYDPAKPEGQAYKRFGDDPGGMVSPVEFHP